MTLRDMGGYVIISFAEIHCASHSGVKKLMISISFSEAYAQFGNKNNKFKTLFKRNEKNNFPHITK